MARQPKTNTKINEKDYYRITVDIGYDVKGKRIRKQFYGRTKTEAENKKKEYMKALESGLNPDLGCISLEKSMHTWLWEIEKNSGIKSSTFEKYESLYRNYIEGTEIGRISVQDIKKIAIQKYYNELLGQGKSFALITSVNKLLNKFFKYAESEQYIIKNPITGLKLPKDNENDIEIEGKEIETFTKEETKTILKNLGNVKLKYIVMFALLTGCRQGEILALTKDDIKGDTVRINKSLRRVKVFDDQEKYHYETKATTPKTKTSNRIVPLPTELMPQLKKLDILIKQERLKLGSAYTDNDLLFPSLTGTYMDPANIRLSWERALKKMGIKYKKFHALRHTYATRLFENDVSILTVSKLLGHGSIKTTEIYTHVLEDIKQKEVQCLNNMLK